MPPCDTWVAALRFELSAYQNLIDGYIYPPPLRRRRHRARRLPRLPVLPRPTPGSAALEASVLLEPRPAGGRSTSAAPWCAAAIATPATPCSTCRPIGWSPTSASYGSGQRARSATPTSKCGTTLVRRQDQVPPTTVYRLPTAGYALFHVEAGRRRALPSCRPAAPAEPRRHATCSTRRYRDYLSRYRLFVDDPGRDVVVRLAVPFGNTQAR